MTFNSDELNFLVYRYLQESGFQHSAFTFGLESHISHSNIDGSLIPVGALINIVQKGIFYTEAEICTGDDGIDQHMDENLSLIDSVIPEFVANQQSKRQNATTNIKEEDNAEEDTESITSIVASTETLRLNSSIEVPSVKCTVLMGHECEVFICSWCPTSDILASGSGDGTARLWDVTDHVFTRPPLTLSHYMERTSEVTRNKDVTAIHWKYDGKLLATGSYDGYARIWHRDGRISRTLGQHKGPIFAMKWNKKANYIISAGMDRTTYIWDVACSRFNKQLNFHSAPVLDIDWCTNDCYATCGIDRLIYVCSLDHDQPIKSFKGHTNEVNVIKWDPQGNLLASCSDDKTVKVWSMKQDTFVHNLEGHTKEIYTLKWSPTGPGTDNPNKDLILATASYDAVINLWDVERGVLAQSLLKHTDPVYSIDFSPDGKYLASGSFDNYINVWSLQNGQLIYSCKVSSGIFDVSWNHTSEKLCASSADGKLHVLDLRKL